LEIAPVLIDTSIAIPIGLIINEAITNSIKYALPIIGGKSPSNYMRSVKKIVVVVADDGVGIDMELVNKPTQSMGLRLMKGLCGDIGRYNII